MSKEDKFNSDRRSISGCEVAQGVGGEEEGEELLGDGKVWPHHQSDGYTGVHICENTSTLRMGGFIMQIIAP